VLRGGGRSGQGQRQRDCSGGGESRIHATSGEVNGQGDRAATMPAAMLHEALEIGDAVALDRDVVDGDQARNAGP
jgi:hypothetical protein